MWRILSHNTARFRILKVSGFLLGGDVASDLQQRSIMSQIIQDSPWICTLVQLHTIWTDSWRPSMKISLKTYSLHTFPHVSDLVFTAFTYCVADIVQGWLDCFEVVSVSAMTVSVANVWRKYFSSFGYVLKTFSFVLGKFDDGTGLTHKCLVSAVAHRIIIGKRESDHAEPSRISLVSHANLRRIVNWWQICERTHRTLRIATASEVWLPTSCGFL